MATNIAEKVDRLDYKVDTLESALGTFIVSTNSALLRLEREMREFKNEMKNEMREFKNEMREFKNEMSDFKDEMGEFKDEMREFKDEMREFKDEMREFKNEAERDRKRMNKRWGELANKMGTLVEDIVAPNIPGVAKKYFGIEDFDTVAIRVRRKNSRYPEKRREFDVIASTETHFVVNETKATPRINYIDMMIEILDEIDDWFPEHRGKKLIPIFSSLSIQEDIAKYLTRNRIFGMGMKDDIMHLVNFDELSHTLSI